MSDIGFGGRLAYLRWLGSRGRVNQKSDREFAEEVGLGESWVRKWKFRSDAPERRTEETAFEACFGAQATRWLYDQEGQPPEPAAWKGWLMDWKKSQPSVVAAPEREEGGKAYLERVGKLAGRRTAPAKPAKQQGGDTA